MSQTPNPPRAKHLMDPDAPRKVATAEDRARLDRVQKWVMSVLVATTIFHLSAGLVISAVVIDDSERVAQVGLCVLAGAFGVIAIAAAFAIHRRPVFSPWLALGFVPTLIGLLIVLM